MEASVLFYDFGPYRIDARRNLLLCDGRKEDVTPKQFAVLKLLVSNHQKIVKKKEICEKVWRLSLREREHEVNNCVSALRRKLKDSATESKYIGTINGVGYKCVCDVTVVSATPEPPVPEKQEPRSRFRTTPEAISLSQVRVMIVKNGFYSSKYHETGKGIVHQYESQIHEEALIVVDRATGLMWDQGISQYFRHRSRETIEAVNAKKFAGFGDWRLPTLEEAMSLVTPTKEAGGLHIHPSFARMGDHVIWTADDDAEDPEWVWVVDFRDGRCKTKCCGAPADTKPVRSIDGDAAQG